METEFKLPELGENIDSGDLVRLMIKPGASIAIAAATKKPDGTYDASRVNVGRGGIVPG